MKVNIKPPFNRAINIDAMITAVTSEMRRVTGSQYWQVDSVSINDGKVTITAKGTFDRLTCENGGWGCDITVTSASHAVSIIQNLNKVYPYSYMFNEEEAEKQ